MTLDKNLLGLFSVAITVVSTVPYILSTIKGKTRPHVFSWVLWSAACFVIGFAQYLAGAGPGAWSAATSTVTAGSVVILCLMRRADWSITRSDWAAFLLGFAIIPVWCMTHDPLWASLLATFIDSLAYYPTFRKSWARPDQELISLYLIANVKHLCSIGAMTVYSLTALFMPVAMLFINVALITLLVWRRRVLKLY